jgi:hypothetical protein
MRDRLSLALGSPAQVNVRPAACDSPVCWARVGELGIGSGLGLPAFIGQSLFVVERASKIAVPLRPAGR